MTARIKGFDEPFKEIESVTFVGSTYVDDLYNVPVKDLEFEQEPTLDHWQHLRERAAIAAMQGVMNFFGSIDYNRETIAELAVKQADALIKKLKGE